MRPERSTKTSLCGATIKKVKCQDQQFYSPQSSLTCTPPERERITPCVRLIADNHGHYPQMPVRSITEPGSEIQCIHIFFACTSQKEALKSVELGCRTTRCTGQRLRLIQSCRLLPSYIILHQRDQSANMIFVPKSSQAARPHSARGAAGELGRSTAENNHPTDCDHSGIASGRMTSENSNNRKPVSTRIGSDLNYNHQNSGSHPSPLSTLSHSSRSRSIQARLRNYPLRNSAWRF